MNHSDSEIVLVSTKNMSSCKTVILSLQNDFKYLIQSHEIYYTSSTLPKLSQRSRSILQDGSRSLGLFWKEKNLSYN